MKIVILGASGQLGKEFENYLRGKEEIYALTHAQLDILDFKKLSESLNKIKPDCVINCSAYTKVDMAEDEIEECFKVNTIGAKNVSYASYKINAKVIYFSTDYIFDGNKDSPYTEFDEPNPLSFYGKSKLLGEEYTKIYNPNHLILRISWLYGINGRNFVKTIIQKGIKERELKIVDDQVGSPTYTLDVVRQTLKLIEEDKVGIYHSSNQGEISWYKFAKKIFEILNIDKINILPIKTEDYPAKAKRPKYSALENYLLKLENLNIMRDWERALTDFLDTYGSSLINSYQEKGEIRSV
ncbi:MAG: dTDP-4-dehydrorhamnose reductase [Dictyoglomaceae bacterium]